MCGVDLREAASGVFGARIEQCASELPRGQFAYFEIAGPVSVD